MDSRSLFKAEQAAEASNGWDRDIEGGTAGACDQKGPEV
ncbi:hypothetical protein ALC60_08324 [Trachymyrmex zeteki]|uniref:Uncharacterized protein n=1 Tax=Mycetomoellerius zeteki TaxID=64791 RepID=A0A151WXM1_9HYME|nr:hypothetical protein ALC60_08324 [Trachymyrmex zeteki]